jgi:hypothetical protein
MPSFTGFSLRPFGFPLSRTRILSRYESAGTKQASDPAHRFVKAYAGAVQMSSLTAFSAVFLCGRG